MKIDLIGQGYEGRSKNVAASRSINFYPETGAPGDKTVISLVGTPGTSIFTSAGALPTRGMHVFGGLLYVVAGGRLYSISATGAVSAALGTLVTSVGRVAMADNGLAMSGVGGNQLMIVDGVAGYIYNVTTGVFTMISGGGWPASGAGTVTYIDGYFVIGQSGGMTAYCSNLYDGTTWGTLALSPISAAPDTIQAAINVHQQLWFIKQYTSEVWYDAGTATSAGFPFLRMSGAVIDYGTPAPASVARGDNSFFFLANQRNNDGDEFVGVVEMNGFTPQLVTPASIVYRMGAYPTITDAFAYCYSDEGHTFYVLTFPAGNATWVYDATTQLWHERSTWTGAPYATGRHVGNSYARLNGMHLVGDYRNGNIYQMAGTIYQDNGNPLVSVRTAGHLFDAKSLDNLFIHRLVVDMETGVGDATTGLDPAVALSWSNDGGHTWSSDYPVSAGPVGAYTTRAVWRRLGIARDRVFRIRISDPVKRVLLGANAE
ncbi:MAG: hypothetical protein ABSC19_05015 [Syntrophorhabdales bacterium]|jgi:hypothetical protein